MGEDTNTVSREEREAAKSGHRVLPTPRYRIARGRIVQSRLPKRLKYWGSARRYAVL